MKTALVTAIGGDIAQGVATILREMYPGCRIIGTEIHARHAGELFADTVCLAPRASEPHYRDWLADLVGREGVELCIPMSEAEMLALAGDAGGAIAGARLVMANREAIAVGCDKLATAQFLASIGCPGPWTVDADSLDREVPLPCIFKSRRGAGSKTVFVCETAEEVGFYRARYPAAILQELLLPADREVTCAIFRARDGRVAVLQLLRTLVGGFTGWARVVNDAETLRQCTTIAEALDLKGAINAQLRLTADGPRIFEINPRFSSTVMMRHLIGFQDVAWSIRDALGEPVEFAVPPAGTTVARIQGAAVLKNACDGGVTCQ
ncbi:MAG: ATP-grasp domain-containing protein [Deltaproteobacteria bacterium]|nr:MAG: ATP-grasp domain-containing protein [Deltaproteobacteria bacterium]